MDIENDNSLLFKYCPKCASADFHLIGDKHFKCNVCGFEFYLNNAAAVAAIITDENGKLLIIERANEPAKGKWDLPGGFVDPGETAEETVKREITEELGVNITLAEYFCSAPNTYRFKGVNYPVLDLAFICTVDDISKIRPLEEIAAVIFKGPDEIDIQNFGFESTKKIISIYLSTINKS